MTEFVPILYVKKTCPHCFKLRLFLLEAGVADRFELRVFTPGDDDEPTIRAELDPHFDSVTFPTVQLAPGDFLQDSDAIVAHYARAFDIDADTLPLFSIYAGSILPRYQALRRTVRAIEEPGR